MMDVEQRIHDAERRQDQASSRIERLEAMLETYMKSIDSNVNKLVTRHEFNPIKVLVYALCGSILTGFLASVMSRVFIK